MKREFIEEKMRQLRVSEKAVCRLVGLAVEETEEQLPLLASAINSNDYGEIQSIAHRIKGYLLNLKFDALGNLAQDINILSLSKGDIQMIKTKFDQFGTGFETLKKELAYE